MEEEVSRCRRRVRTGEVDVRDRSLGTCCVSFSFSLSVPSPVVVVVVVISPSLGVLEVFGGEDCDLIIEASCAWWCSRRLRIRRAYMYAVH